MADFLGRIRRAVVTPRRRMAAAAIRVGASFMALLFFTVHFPQRALLWGARGMLDWHTYAQSTAPGPTSLFAFSPSAAWSEALYWLGVVSCVLFLFGIVPRLTSITTYCLVSSAFNREYMVLDGGENILVIMLLYLCFVDSGHYLSLWSLRLRGKLRRAFIRYCEPLNRIVHNTGMAAIAGQIALLYFWSAFYKISGHNWQAGTALYYILHVNMFSLPGLSEHLYRNAMLVTTLTYATLIFQWSFPILMWNKVAKPFIFLAAVGFHTGIAVVMGLTYFSFTMVIMDLAIFSDSTFIGIARFANRVKAWLGSVRVARPSRKAEIEGELAG
jgi:hypothetical protein